jgi:hypothetical protein
MKVRVFKLLEISVDILGELRAIVTYVSYERPRKEM